MLKDKPVGGFPSINMRKDVVQEGPVVPNPDPKE